jgi:hypothetical protein
MDTANLASAVSKKNLDVKAQQDRLVSMCEGVLKIPVFLS